MRTSLANEVPACYKIHIGISTDPICVLRDSGEEMDTNHLLLCGALRGPPMWGPVEIAVPRSSAGFGFTVAWTKPPQVDFINEGGTAEKAGLMPGDKIVCIDKVKVSKKTKEEIENIVK
ncbi:hypothetical protein X975_25787, partial [Stegodyphus mimosarum]